jgi:hypothetical protein
MHLHARVAHRFAPFAKAWELSGETVCRPYGTRFHFLGLTQGLRPGLSSAAPSGLGFDALRAGYLLQPFYWRWRRFAPWTAEAAVSTWVEALHATAGSSLACGALRNDNEQGFLVPLACASCGRGCLGFDRNACGKTRTGVSAPHKQCHASLATRASYTRRMRLTKLREGRPTKS